MSETRDPRERDEDDKLFLHTSRSRAKASDKEGRLGFSTKIEASSSLEETGKYKEHPLLLEVLCCVLSF